MKKTLIILGCVIVVVFVIALVLILMRPQPKQQGASPEVTFPVGSSDGSNNKPTDVQPITISAVGGSSMEVRNFISNGTTIEDPSNHGNYYLTGATPGEFSISFNQQSQVFTVSLDQEPIGQSRAHAETFLANALGISKAQLCAVRHAVTTTSDVNAAYAGESLDFSSCPDAVQLPY